MAEIQDILTQINLGLSIPKACHIFSQSLLDLIQITESTYPDLKGEILIFHFSLKLAPLALMVSYLSYP